MEFTSYLSFYESRIQADFYQENSNNSSIEEMCDQELNDLLMDLPEQQRTEYKQRLRSLTDEGNKQIEELRANPDPLGIFNQKIISIKSSCRESTLGIREEINQYKSSRLTMNHKLDSLEDRIKQRAFKPLFWKSIDDLEQFNKIQDMHMTHALATTGKVLDLPFVLAFKAGASVATKGADVVKDLCHSHPSIDNKCEQIKDVGSELFEGAVNLIPDFAKEIASTIKDKANQTLATYRIVAEEQTKDNEERLGIPREMSERYYNELPSAVLGTVSIGKAVTFGGKQIAKKSASSLTKNYISNH